MCCGICACVGGCCGKCCGSALGSCFNCKKVKPTAGYTTRVPYLMFMFITIVLALLLKAFGSQALVNIFDYEVSVCSTDVCLGNQAVLRFSFGLTIFFIIMLIVTAVPASSKFHHTCWATKVAIYIILIIISFTIPNDFYDVYLGFSRFGSALFLLLQVLVLIDFAYQWNESWRDREETIYQWGLLGLTILFNIMSIVVWGLAIHWFGGEGCALNNFFISWTIVLSVGFTLLSMMGQFAHGSIFVSSIVTGYCTSLLYNALRSDPSECNSVFTRDTNYGQVLFGLVLAAVSITYTSWSVSREHNILIGDDEEENNEAYKDTPDPKIDTENVELGEEEEEEVILRDDVRVSNTYFHAVMVLAAMYMGMLLTSWASDIYDTSTNTLALGTTNVWVNMITQWVCVFLYIWTFVAPYLFPERIWD